jgi:hypothetical protein
VCAQQARESLADGTSAQQQIGADVTATSSQVLLEPAVSAAESIALLAAAVAAHEPMDIADSSSSDSAAAAVAAAAAAVAVKNEVAVAVAVLEQEEQLQPLEGEAAELQSVVLDPIALGLIQVLQSTTNTLITTKVNLSAVLHAFVVVLYARSHASNIEQ